MGPSGSWVWGAQQDAVGGTLMAHARQWVGVDRETAVGMHIYVSEPLGFVMHRGARPHCAHSRCLAALLVSVRLRRRFLWSFGCSYMCCFSPLPPAPWLTSFVFLLSGSLHAQTQPDVSGVSLPVFPLSSLWQPPKKRQTQSHTHGYPRCTIECVEKQRMRVECIALDAVERGTR